MSEMLCPDCGGKIWRGSRSAPWLCEDCWREWDQRPEAPDLTGAEYADLLGPDWYDDLQEDPMTDSEYCTGDNLTAEDIIELMGASKAWYPTGGECPHCGESRVDWLTWTANGETVICQACRAEYTP